MDGSRTPLKDGLGPNAVAVIARNIVTVWPDFDSASFVRDATENLAALELKDRVAHISGVLSRYLPDDPTEALDVVVSAGDRWTDTTEDPLTAGFAAWPLIDFAGARGPDDYDATMEALRRLTHLFSAEFAIRPLVETDPDRALRHLEVWTDDPDEHVRRLVSEGTRARLPWAAHLHVFRDDPAPLIPILERLADDESEYVRRSVANSLNDTAKDHPDLVLGVCSAWLEQSTPERARVIRQALRSLVRAGDSRALGLLGYDGRAAVAVTEVRSSPERLRCGGQVGFAAELRSESEGTEPVLVDLVVRHDSGRSERRFAWGDYEIPAGGSRRLRKRLKIRHTSTRTWRPGSYEVRVRLNGVTRAVTSFHLTG